MVPSNIEEIFGTLAVGIVATVAFLLVHWLLISRRHSFYRFLSARIPESSFAIVFAILLIYTGGHVVEDISDHITDSNYVSNWLPLRLQRQILGRESFHRVSTLFGKTDEDLKNGSEGKSRVGFSCSLNPLGAEVLSDPRLLSWAQNTIDGMRGGQSGVHSTATEFFGSPKDWLRKHPLVGCLKKPDDEPERVLSVVVNAMYYRAKNWAYSVPNHFDELEGIQRRIDFSRSVFHVAGLLFIASILIALLSLVELDIGERFVPYIAELWSSSSVGGLRVDEMKTFVRAIRVSVIAAGVSALAQQGYGLSERNFNERTFGYFLSNAPSWIENEESAKCLAAPRHRLIPGTCGLSGQSKSLYWVSSAGEFQASLLQTYNAVLDHLETIQGKFVDKQRALIVDLDETVLDNSPFQKLLELRYEGYSDAAWREWVESRRASAYLGAREFLQDVRARGFVVIFVSNRPEDLRQSTMEVLRREGLIDEISTRAVGEIQVLLDTDSSSKESRRKVVSEKFEIVALLGDNLLDFDEEFASGPNVTEGRRRELVIRNSEFWGRKWFIVPNPIYGEWDRACVSPQ